MEDFKFDLQLFADQGTADSADSSQTADAADDTAVTTDDDKVTFDEDTVNAKIADALKAERKKWEQEAKVKEKKAKADAKRMEQLSDYERAKEENEALRKELEQMKASDLRKDMELSTANILAKKGLPAQFRDWMIAEDSESTLARINAFEKHFKKAVEDAVNNRLKSKAPEAGGISLGGATSGNTGSRNAFFEAISKNQARRH